MQDSRTPKLKATAADYIVIGLAPALIMGMVGSVVFFLVVAFYQGQYDTRLMYILGLYTMAIVLIARIAIESGRAYANAFSFPLAIVTLLAIGRFVSFSGPLAPFAWLVNAALLGVAWYLADRITFDCTLVDDKKQSIQRGLLQSLGLLATDDEPSKEKDSAGTRARKAEPRREESGRKEKASRHNPGVWVLYFSLMAIPLFGLGQLTISDSDERRRAFFFLFTYLGSALSLLVTTSFVGLRRYLRQRGVAMPAEMSRSWLLTGIIGVFVILALSLLLPLPGRNAGLVTVPKFLTSSQSLSSQRFGWGDEGTERQENAQAARTHDSAGPQDGPASEGASETSSDQSSEDGTSSAPSEAGEANNANASGEDASGEAGDKPSKPSPSQQDDAARSTDQPQQKQGKSDREAQQAGSEQQEPSQQASSEEEQPDSAGRGAEAANGSESPAQPPEAAHEAPRNSSSQGPLDGLAQWLGTSVAEWLKWLTIILLAAIVFLYAITHPRELMELWRSFSRWWHSLFARQRHQSGRPTAPATVTQPTERLRGFHEFQNPFAEHLQGWSPSQVIEHSFSALEAWAREAGVQRASDQTSAEFVRGIAQAHPAIGRDAVLAAAMLDRLLFAGWRPSQSEVAPLEQLWHAMQKGRETVHM